MSKGSSSLWRKRNKAIMKELTQLHDKKALMPIKKEEMSYDEHQKVLRYLMFLRKYTMGPYRHVDALTEGHNNNI